MQRARGEQRAELRRDHRRALSWGSHDRAGPADAFCGQFSPTCGEMFHSNSADRWGGMASFGAGDAMRLLLDSDAGTLKIKKNGAPLGVAVRWGAHRRPLLGGEQQLLPCWHPRAHSGRGPRGLLSARARCTQYKTV